MYYFNTCTYGILWWFLFSLSFLLGVILFVNSRTQFDRLIRDTATDCGEYYLSPTWRPGTFTNSQVMLKTSRLPDLVILLNWHTNVQAIRESIMCNIPTVCLTDSDSDPRLVTYAVPGNDDTPSSVKFFCEAFRDVIRNAKSNGDSEWEREGDYCYYCPCIIKWFFSLASESWHAS